MRPFAWVTSIVLRRSLPFFFTMSWTLTLSQTVNDTHTQNSQAPNSALSKQVGQVRCKAVLTIQRISPWRDQRAGKRSAARHGQHAHPPFPPSEEHGTAQQWGCGPSPHTCKVTHEVGSLSTRPPVSMPTTTKRQRSPARSSWYLRSLAIHGL